MTLITNYNQTTLTGLLNTPTLNSVPPPIFKIKPTPLHPSGRHAGKVCMCTFSVSSRMSSQEPSLPCRIGHCKSLPAAPLSPHPAQAPQRPQRERWLRRAFPSAPFLLSSSGWSFEQAAGPTALWLFLSVQATNVLKQHSLITWH